MEKEKSDAVVVRISKELADLIEKMKEPIQEFSWEAIKPSDYEASKILARKIKDLKLL